VTGEVLVNRVRLAPSLYGQGSSARVVGARYLWWRLAPALLHSTAVLRRNSLESRSVLNRKGVKAWVCL